MNMNDIGYNEAGERSHQFNEIGYTESGERTQVTAPVFDWEAQMEMVRQTLDLERVPEVAQFIGTLGEVSVNTFPERLCSSLHRWIVNRVGTPKLHVIRKKRFVTMDSSSASKRVSRLVKAEWAEMVQKAEAGDGEYPDEEDLMALIAFYVNRERHNLDLRREFALMKNACLATKDLPQGSAQEECGRWFYEMPPIVELSRFGDMEHEPFKATLVTPDGKVTSEKTFTRLQNALRTLSGIKKGSAAQIMSKLFSGDYVASTACVKAGKEWKVLIFPMRDPRKAESSFKDDDEQPVSVFDYEQSVLQRGETEVDELVVEDPFTDEPLDMEGADTWSCLPDMNRTYCPYTDTYYNSRPLLTLMANEAGVSTEFNNSGLTANVREELGALYVNYCRKVGKRKVTTADGKTLVFPVYGFNKLGFLKKKEFAKAVSNEMNSLNAFFRNRSERKPNTRCNIRGSQKRLIAASIENTKLAYFSKVAHRAQKARFMEQQRINQNATRYNESSAWSAACGSLPNS